MKQRFKQAGSSLIEMVVAIVVISIALTGILGLINNISRNSVDPVIQVQASSFARGMLELVVEQEFNSIQSLSWDELKAAYPNSPAIAYAEQAKYEIEIGVAQQSFLSLPADLVKRVDITVKHLLIPQGLTVTYYKTRAQVLTQAAGTTTPAFTTPESTTPAFITPPFTTPDATTPAFTTPDTTTPAWVIPESTTPAWIPEPTTPAWVTPESTTPAWVTPESTTPAWVTPESTTPAWIPEPTTPAWVTPPLPILQAGDAESDSMPDNTPAVQPSPPIFFDFSDEVFTFPEVPTTPAPVTPPLPILQAADAESDSMPDSTPDVQPTPPIFFDFSDEVFTFPEVPTTPAPVTPEMDVDS